MMRCIMAFLSAQRPEHFPLVFLINAPLQAGGSESLREMSASSMTAFVGVSLFAGGMLGPEAQEMPGQTAVGCLIVPSQRPV